MCPAKQAFQAESKRNQYRFWSSASLVSVLLLVPAVVAIRLFTNYSLGREYWWIGPVIWMAIVWFVGYRALCFECPRCGKPFFRTKWSYSTWAKKCRHCGLPKWHEDSPG